MKRVLLALACVAGAACGGGDRTVAEAFAPAVTATTVAVELGLAPDAAPPPPSADPEPLAARPSRPKLAVKLRSTPPGAAVSVDGRLVGVTPTRVEVDDDGRPRDFSFVLSGHETWKLRFAPTHAGVIHATLRESIGPDAGPR